MDDQGTSAAKPATAIEYVAEQHLAGEIASLRDRRRFEAACAAMQGMAASDWHGTFTDIARDAVAHADALLAELEKPR